MKATSYEISKQLAEAGFEAEPDWYYGETMPYDNFEVNKYNKHLVPAYGLETILKVLPKTIETHYLAVEFGLSESRIGCNGFHIAFRNKDESLVDTAAKLWLKLKKENLI